MSRMSMATECNYYKVLWILVVFYNGMYNGMKVKGFSTLLRLRDGNALQTRLREHPIGDDDVLTLGSVG